MRVLNIEGMEACLHFTSQTGALLEGCTLNIRAGGLVQDLGLNRRLIHK